MLDPSRRSDRDPPLSCCRVGSLRLLVSWLAQEDRGRVACLAGAESGAARDCALVFRVLTAARGSARVRREIDRGVAAALGAPAAELARATPFELAARWSRASRAGQLCDVLALLWAAARRNDHASRRIEARIAASLASRETSLLLDGSLPPR